MLFSFNQFPDPEDQDWDVCVVGAGPAGITLALLLADRGRRVLLLEGGSLEFTDVSQDLYVGEQDGYADLDIARLRYFGGTSNHWTGYCRRPDATDLAGHPLMPESAWPLPFAELDPYLTKAAEIVDVPDQFDAGHWAKVLETHVPDMAPFGLEPGVSVLGPPVRFNEAYVDPVRAHENLVCLTEANVTEIVLAASGSAVESLRVRGTDGAERMVSARRIVLACGGLETPRLLMNSDARLPGGIGNGAGMLGKYFSDHRVALVAKADIVSADLGLFSRFSHSIGPKNNVVPHARLTSEIAAAEGIGRGDVRFRELGLFAGETKTGRRLNTALSKLPFTLQRTQTYELRMFAESLPRAENALRLMDDRDALGMRRIRLDYAPHPIEHKTVNVVLDRVTEMLGASGAGRVHSLVPVESDEAFFDWGYHHYGTLRMSAAPEDGVVDPNLRIHGMEDLYAVSSGVFPSSSMQTPTMTVVALAVRLADHLETELAI